MRNEGVTPHSAAAEALAGCTGGVLGTLLGYPLDSIKTRMQAGAGGGMMPLARQIVQLEGWRGLYRGVGSPLVALTILNALNFSSYAFFKKEFGVRDIDAGFANFEVKVPLAAACVAPLSSLISTPFELVKTQAVQSIKFGGSKSSSAIVIATGLVREHGIRALYTAHGVNTAREVVFLSTYFSFYEHSKSQLKVHLPSNVAILLSGGLSGAMGWLISFPLDCIKSNLHGRQLGKEPQPSAVSVFSSLVRTKGIGGLYSGLVPSLARAFLVSSSRFLAYETTLFLCNKAW